MFVCVNAIAEPSRIEQTAITRMISWYWTAIVLPIASSQRRRFDRLLRADREPQNWLSYSGTVFSQRHSLLTQITPANVKNLELQWVWQARSLEKFEATALVGGRRPLHACRGRP